MSSAIFIISKNCSFYNIKKDVFKVIINGNFNKVVNPHKITNLYINGNNNEIKIINNGEIKYIKICGNNNKLFIKDAYRRNYVDLGNKNVIIKTHYSSISSNRNLNSHLFNKNTDNSSNIDTLKEYFFSYVPYLLKEPYSEECLFCNSEFIRTDKIKFFPCKKHIFHSRCFEKNDDKNINSLRCPKCENVNNNNSNLSNNNLGPNHNLHSDNNSEDNNNDNSEESNNENDNDNHDNDEESNDEDNNEENEEFEDDLDSFVERGLDKEMLDNMPIFKIKDAEKLNDDKKMCWICFGNFVNGDDSIALPCIHIFHANCIKVWLKDHKICPNCKEKIKYEFDNF